jgi:hypothetical protein
MTDYQQWEVISDEEEKKRIQSHFNEYDKLVAEQAAKKASA